MNEVKTITLSNIVEKAEGNIVSDMNGEKVMLSIANGKYYNLGKVGGDIWDRVNSLNTISEIIDELTAQFDVENSECEKHVLEFLEQLLKEELIVIKE